MNNIQYFIEAARRKRQELLGISAYRLGEIITDTSRFSAGELDALGHLVSDNVLTLSALPSGDLGIILVERSIEAFSALLVFSTPPMSSISLTPVPEGPEWRNVPAITRYRLHELVEVRIRQLDDELARLEALAKRDLSDECTCQRKEFDSLRQHLAECRTLSLMRNFALSRDTMEDLVSLAVHIKAELAIKATGNN
jgi:hypothetical protein